MKNFIRFGENFIELKFNASWHYVQALWDFIRGLLAIFLRDSSRSDVISTAIIEIVENAVKYSKKDENGFSDINFRLTMDKDTRLIHLEVENPADHEHIKIFQGELDRIMKAEDRQKVYREKLMEAALREDGKSQLGLVRIIVEANADMDTRIEGDNIVVTADFHVPIR
jgi:hypothetical protein